MAYRYVIIDNNKYVVQVGTYIRKWTRAFTSQLSANIIRLNFVDRGPGIQVYDMTLILAQWSPDSEPYKDGITQSVDQQRKALETSYTKVATPISFYDPFGEQPQINGGPDEGQPSGVYFTNMNEIIPNYSTVQKTYVQMEVELTAATQIVA